MPSAADEHPRCLRADFTDRPTFLAKVAEHRTQRGVDVEHRPAGAVVEIPGRAV